MNAKGGMRRVSFGLTSVEQVRFAIEAIVATLQEFLHGVSSRWGFIVNSK